MSLEVPLHLFENPTDMEIAAVQQALSEFHVQHGAAFRKRRLRDHHALIVENRPAFRIAAARWLRVLRTEIGETVAGIHSLEDVDRKVDWAAVEQMGRSLLGGLYYDMLLRAGIRLVKQRLDPIGTAAVNAARKKSAKMVTVITRETRNALRAATAQAIDLGIPTASLGRSIRPLIGLNEPQSKALGRRAAGLLEEGYSESEVSQLMGRWADKAIRYRGEMIATTETARATSDGILTAYEQNDISKTDWIADPLACEKCLERAEASPYTMEEADGLIPLHPWCECTWVVAA